MERDTGDTEQSLPNSWNSLRRFTDARIGLPRTGTGISTTSVLDFKLDHAHARDAVYSTLDFESLLSSLEKLNLEYCRLHSRAPTREVYLQRPDLGRRLDENSVEKLKRVVQEADYDIGIVLADGLSATAVNENAVPLLSLLIPLIKNAGRSVSPIVFVEQGRVAIGDEIGALVKARMAVILIGERPGLSSPNSLGAYLTYHPAVGLTDETRNCVSNIRAGGLNVEEACEKIFYLIQESLKRKLSGVALKDNSGYLT